MKSRAPKVRVSKPSPTLTALVNRPGGMLRDAAIARGQAALEVQREPARKALLLLIAALDVMAQGAVSANQLRELQRLTDQVISLASLFGMMPLEGAGKRLSELLSVLQAKGLAHGEAIAVHVRAMRLFAAAGEQAPGVMEELDRVLAHFGASAPA